MYGRMPDGICTASCLREQQVCAVNRGVWEGKCSPRCQKQAAVAVRDQVQSARLGIEPGVEHVTPLSDRAAALALTCVTASERAVKYMAVLIC